MTMKTITHIVVHYSATFEDQNLTVADIDKMHKARGWKGVGYHYVIRRDGVVEKGRPDNVVGAHVGGQNSGKIGICAIGGVNRATGPNVGVDNRTQAQIKAQIALIKTLLAKYPKAKVVGHRDLAPTQCPGFDVIPWWASVMAGKPPVETYTPWTPSKVPLPPVNNGKVVHVEQDGTVKPGPSDKPPYVERNIIRILWNAFLAIIFRRGK